MFSEPDLSNETHLHLATQLRMAQRNLNYAEAIVQVQKIAHLKQKIVQFSGQLDDNAEFMHAQAELYALETGCSYELAIAKYQAQQLVKQTMQFNETDNLDWKIHTAAMHYMAQHAVSYCEAVMATAPNFNTTNFAESDTVEALQAQDIEIFQAGTVTSDAGDTLTFTNRDIEEMAVCYDPKKREAPLCIGHPDNNLPAYGWVSQLQTKAGKLFMRVKQLDPSFAELVKNGRYKKRSAALYPPQHLNNPCKGKWYLRHVAWLGAAQPAVAGMPNVQFKDAAQDCVSLSW